MINYRKIEFGHEAVEYMRECLAAGHTLANLLLRGCDLERGKMYTYLPTNISDEAAKEFETGGKLSPLSPHSHGQITVEGLVKRRVEPKPSTDSYLATEVHTFLGEAGEHICLFEDASARPNDPFLSAVDTRISVFGDEVYHLLSQADVNEGVILKTIRQAASWLFIGVMTATPNTTYVCSQRRVLTPDELSELARNAKKIIVGAYDGESYLICHLP